MKQFNGWATKHGVSTVALDELRAILTAPVTDPTHIIKGVSEAAVQSAVRLEASDAGCRLWRNNVGACKDERGRVIRYGLVNESKELNGRIKSSDLVGGRPVIITQNMIGSTICQLLVREVKKIGWVYTGTPREVAQLRFLNLVLGMGGDACFVNGWGTI